MLWALVSAIPIILCLYWAFDNSPRSWSSYPDLRRSRMEPTEKNPEIENFLEQNFGRSTAITTNRCVPPPFGCGKPIDGFSSPLTAREYRISGLCENCQREIFS